MSDPIRPIPLPAPFVFLRPPSQSVPERHSSFKVDGEIQKTAQDRFSTPLHQHAGVKRSREHTSVDQYFAASTDDPERFTYIERAPSSPLLPAYGGAGFRSVSPEPENREAFEKACLVNTIKKNLSKYHQKVVASVSNEDQISLKELCHKHLSDLMFKELKKGHSQTYLYPLMLEGYLSSYPETPYTTPSQMKIDAEAYSASIFKEAFRKLHVQKMETLFNDLTNIYMVQFVFKGDFYNLITKQNYQRTSSDIADTINELFKLSFSASDIYDVVKKNSDIYIQKTRPKLPVDEADALSKVLTDQLIEAGNPTSKFPSPYTEKLKRLI